MLPSQYDRQSLARRPVGIRWFDHHPVHGSLVRRCCGDEQCGRRPRRNGLVLCVEHNGRVGKLPCDPVVCVVVADRGQNWLVRSASDVEQNVVSVERITHYANELPSEAPRELPDSKPPVGWPSAGEVEFR